MDYLPENLTRKKISKIRNNLKKFFLEPHQSFSMSSSFHHRKPRSSFQFPLWMSRVINRSQENKHYGVKNCRGKILFCGNLIDCGVFLQHFGGSAGNLDHFFSLSWIKNKSFKEPFCSSNLVFLVDCCFVFLCCSRKKFQGPKFKSFRIPDLTTCLSYCVRLNIGLSFCVFFVC